MPTGFLTDSERARLNRFPTEVSSNDLAAYFTLSEADLAQINQHRRSQCLGFALQLCALRYLGFPPQDNTSSPYSIIKYLAQQLSISPDSLQTYGDRIPTRTAHFQEIQRYLGFRKATPVDLDILSSWLTDRALEHNLPTLLLQLACEKLRRDKIVRPGVTRLEKMVATSRSRAQLETHRRLQPLLTKDRQALLDQVLIVNEATGHTTLSWLRQRATSNSSQEILQALQKLTFLRGANVEAWNLSELNPNRVKFLAQIGRKATNQYLQRASEDRRYPILVATLKQSLIDLTDEIIEMFDQCLWGCYTDARKDLQTFQKSVARSMNEKLFLFRKIGQVLLNPQVPDWDVRSVSFKSVPPEHLQVALEETDHMIRPRGGECFDFLARRYSYIRRFSPAFLATFIFHSNKADDPLLEAIEILRELDCHRNQALVQRQLLEAAPLEIVPDKWMPFVFDEHGQINRRYYELCALWVLRGALRSGDVWLDHSRQYANLDSYLIPSNQWPSLRPEFCRQVNTPQDGAVRLQEREDEISQLLPKVDRLLLHDDNLRLENGKVVVSPFEAEDRPASTTLLRVLGSLV